MAFINSSHLLAATYDTINGVNMETLQEQTYAGLYGDRSASVYTGHRTRDVRFTNGYGITFDGSRTVYLSLSNSYTILAIDTNTDEVKVEVQSSLIYPYKLYFDVTTNSLLTIVSDRSYGRPNLGKWNLVTKELSFLLSRTSVSNSETISGLDIGSYWFAEAVNVGGSIWMIGDHGRDNR